MQIQRFRGQSYGNSPTSGGPPYSSTPTYPMSSYLRHRMNSNSSLGEALATLPSPPTPSNKSKTPDSPASLTTQVFSECRKNRIQFTSHPKRNRKQFTSNYLNRRQFTCHSFTETETQHHKGRCPKRQRDFLGIFPKGGGVF